MDKTQSKKIKFLNECKLLAESRGGACVSEYYISTHTNLTWKCVYGHIWDAMPSNVKRGKWCPVCSKNKKLTINNCIELALSRDGYCLSKEYISSGSLMKWQCKYGHVWEATYNNLKTKKCWCPECKLSIGEKICRILFEQYFNKSFDKCRPNWLLNNKGSKMELDGYNSDLKIAFEYQGIQHYKVDGFFIKDKNELESRILDDKVKVQLCSDRGISLVVVPYFKNFSNEILMDTFYNSLDGCGLKVERKEFNINFSEIYNNKIEIYKKIAITRGGKCLSNTYIDYYSKLTWECKFGHVWNSLGYSIERGHWCPDCAGNRKGSIYKSKNNLNRI